VRLALPDLDNALFDDALLDGNGLDGNGDLPRCKFLIHAGGARGKHRRGSEE
jgi:hypothetical protein